MCSSLNSTKNWYECLNCKSSLGTLAGLGSQRSTGQQFPTAQQGVRTTVPRVHQWMQVVKEFSAKSDLQVVMCFTWLTKSGNEDASFDCYF